MCGLHPPIISSLKVKITLLSKMLNSVDAILSARIHQESFALIKEDYSIICQKKLETPETVNRTFFSDPHIIKKHLSSSFT